LWWKLAGLALVAGIALFVLLAPIATLDVKVALPGPPGHPAEIDHNAGAIAQLVVVAAVALTAMAVFLGSIWAAWRVVRGHRRSAQ
jgi:hypothetical protein